MGTRQGRDLPPDEIVTASACAEYCGRWEDGDPIHALLAAVLQERELILLAYAQGCKLVLTWTEHGPKLDLSTVFNKTVRRAAPHHS